MNFHKVHEQIVTYAKGKLYMNIRGFEEKEENYRCQLCGKTDETKLYFLAL